MLQKKISHKSVSEVVAILKKTIMSKGVKVFAVIDHAKEARDAGLELRDEVLIIFGNPKVGTALMKENPSIGIELPLKILVWQDENNATNISYQNPVELGQKYNIHEHQDILEKLRNALDNLIDGSSL